MGFRIFLRVWNDFAAKTELGIVIEKFCRIEVGFRILLFEERREEELDLDIFVQKRKTEKRIWTSNNLSN